MSDTPRSAENLKLPTGKLGQPTTDTAIARATDAATASKAIAENGPQITLPAPGAASSPAAAGSASATAQARISAATVPFLDLFQGPARLSAQHMQTFCDTWISLGRGVRDIQVQWLDTIGAATGMKPEIWQVQRDLYVQGVDRMFDTMSRVMTFATSRLSRDATH